MNASSQLEYLPFHRPAIAEEEIAAVTRVLRSGWLTTGEEAHAFEQEFAEFVRAPHALALNSCTAALHLALTVLDLRPGDEVLLPTTTFAATAEVVTYCGAVPVLCDVLPTLNLDPEDLAHRITPRSRAVIAVHMAGQPADLEAIQRVAQAHGLPVIEDAAHSLPAFIGDRIVGQGSELACFSFYATKNLTTGEGGMLTTTRTEWADRARRLALHGISRDAWKRYTASGGWYYEILEPGFKYNLTDIQAALGRVQLRRQMKFLETRERLVAAYRQRLGGDARVGFPEVRPGVRPAWHLLIVELQEEDRYPGLRDRVMDRLRQNGIGASVHFIPLHMHPYYRDRFGYRPESLPQAAIYYSRSLSLPLYPDLQLHQVERICDTLSAALDQA